MLMYINSLSSTIPSPIPIILASTSTMRSAITLSVAALASLSAGQATPQNNYPYTIDPESVSSSDRGVYR